MNAVYEKVTQRIIEQLQKGVVPWRKSWRGQSAANWITQKPYRGINRLLLDGGEYISFKQCSEHNGKVKKGAKSNFIVFWKWYEKEIEKDGEITVEKLPVLRYYNVFHIDDCEGIETRVKWNENNLRNVSVDEVIHDYISSQNIALKTVTGSNKAYYRPSDDSILLPDIKQFKDTSSYYSVVLHELIHSTGNKARLDRIRSTAFASKEYSIEELVAEIGSSMLMAELGIEQADTFENSVAYINSWIEVLQSDNRMIITAASRAEKAVEMILGEGVYEDVE